MSRTRGCSGSLFLAVALSAGCSRAEIDRDLDRGEAVADQVKDRVQTAKRELQRVKEKLPPAEKVRAELAEAKRNLALKLKAAQQDLKSELEHARDDTR